MSWGREEEELADLADLADSAGLADLAVARRALSWSAAGVADWDCWVDMNLPP